MFRSGWSLLLLVSAEDASYTSSMRASRLHRRIISSLAFPSPRKSARATRRLTRLSPTLPPLRIPCPLDARLQSSSSARPSTTLTSAQQTAYSRLRPIIDSFTAPIDWAVAYGSGVVHQANTSPTGPPPLTDFLFSTPSPGKFHTVNLRQNPSHYPVYARLLGGSAIGWLQENWGAGVWYVTMVRIRNIEVKYGVISTARLRRDLVDWDTLYAAGRLHKPVLPLRTLADLEDPLQANHRSALNVSLLLLSPDQTFSELALWEQIAGISYSGDPRMSVPGAENPEKVKNIVRGEGVLEGFRELYSVALRDTPSLRWEGEKQEEGDWSWRGRGEEVLEQLRDTDHYASILASLPLTLRHKVSRHFQSALLGAEGDSEADQSRARELTLRQETPEGLDFWRRVAKEARFREVLLNELRQIIRRPALTQSIKGLFTAGPAKSLQYSLAKFRKWLRGRKKT